MARMNKTCKVYSIDSNAVAAGLCEANAKLNKVQDRVVSIHGDAGEVIKDKLAGQAGPSAYATSGAKSSLILQCLHSRKKVLCIISFISGPTTRRQARIWDYRTHTKLL